MKKTIRYLPMAGLMFIAQTSFAQVDIVGHAGAAGQYVGWNAPTAIPLAVQHLGNQQIRFSTNGNQRMLINNGGANTTDGRVAMSNNAPAGFAPAARLHLFQFGGTGLNGDMFRTDGPETVQNSWSMWTGTTQAGATEKFRQYTPASAALNISIVFQTMQTGDNIFTATDGLFRSKINGGLSYSINDSLPHRDLVLRIIFHYLMKFDKLAMKP